MRSPAHSVCICADRHESYLPLAPYMTQNGDGQRKWRGFARKAAHADASCLRQLFAGALSTRGTDSIGNGALVSGPARRSRSRRTRFARRLPPWVTGRPRRTSRLRGDASRTRPTLRRALFPLAVLPLRELGGRSLEAEERRLLDAGEIEPTGLRYVGAFRPTTHLPRRWPCCTLTSRPARGA
jgi:hypothetical protein